MKQRLSAFLTNFFLYFVYNDEYDTIRALNFIKAIESCLGLFKKGLLSFQKNALRVERWYIFLFINFFFCAASVVSKSEQSKIFFTEHYLYFSLTFLVNSNKKSIKKAIIKTSTFFKGYCCSW